MSKHTVNININGTTVTKEVDSRMLLVHFLREELQMTGTHIGCDTSHCGACTVLMNGRSVKSCTLFMVQANGKSLKTIEGMEKIVLQVADDHLDGALAHARRPVDAVHDQHPI